MYKKRLTALLLAALLIFSTLTLTGCKNDDEEEITETSESEEVSGFVPADAALTITIPANAATLIEENLYTMAASFGITDIRDGANGALICYIEDKTKQEVQMAAKRSLFDTTEYLANNTDFIVSAEVGYDCESITFFCDGSAYIEPSDIYLMSYYIPAMTYHSLTTPDQDFLFNKKITFTFLDSETFRQLGVFEFTGDVEEKR